MTFKTLALPKAGVSVSDIDSDLIRARLISLLEEAKISTLSRNTGIPQTTLRKYSAGAMPGFDKAALIASALDVSLDWLATGNGAHIDHDNSTDDKPSSSLITSDLLKAAFHLVEDWLSVNDRQMETAKKVEVAFAICEMALEDADQEEPKIEKRNVERILRLVS